MRRLAARQQPGADLQTYDGTLPAILDAADAFSRGGAIHVPAEPAAITALPRPDERGLHGQVQGYGYSCMAGAPRVRRGREGVSGRGEDGVHAGPLSRAAIDRNSKKKDAAYEYIKFMASGKAQRAMAIEAGNIRRFEVYWSPSTGRRTPALLRW